VLSGDLERASALLAEAAIQDPDNDRVQASVVMLEGRVRGRF
jgi:Flp pilus assembly protein TadD